MLRTSTTTWYTVTLINFSKHYFEDLKDIQVISKMLSYPQHLFHQRSLHWSGRW